jgi:hypothetical protein
MILSVTVNGNGFEAEYKTEIWDDVKYAAILLIEKEHENLKN